MGWSIITAKSADSTETKPQRLPEQGTVHLVISPPLVSNKLACVHDVQKFHTELGRITIGQYGAHIEAIKPGLSVTAQAHAEHPTLHGAGFELMPDMEQRAAALLLRHGDVVRCSTAEGSIAFTWAPSEVQVNSSAAETAQPERGRTSGIAETDDEETGDEEDLDTTMTMIETTQRKSSQLRATPLLSHQPSMVIHETPTVDRINGIVDDTAVSEIRLTPKENKVIPSGDARVTTDEQYSTARTGESQHGDTERLENEAEHSIAVATVPQNADVQAPDLRSPDARHPKVVVARKRPSPPVEMDVPHIESSKRPNKRVKKEVDQDGAGGNTPARSRSRLSEVKGSKNESPRASRSPRSSQGANAQIYEGPAPAVAFSNSSLAAGSHSVKFLKKQGGTIVESMKDEFSVLCIRDGSLHKTAKVLRAITMGIPIATDKWLIDSAKAGHLLSPEAYKPAVPDQEKEWNFSLEKVLGKPQTPLEGFKIHFTTKLRSEYATFSEIEQVCIAAGAKKVTTKKMDKTGTTILLASDNDDDESEAMLQEGATCYHRDLLPLSIFRGFLDLDSDEFRLQPSHTTNSKKDTNKRRGRKI